MIVKDQHVQPERGRDRQDIFDHMRKVHDEGKVADARANPHFNKYIKERRAAHEATKKRD